MAILPCQKLSNKINFFHRVQLFFEFYEQNLGNFYADDEFFIQPENELAHNKLNRFFLQKNYDDSLLKTLILHGSAASGKTHISHIFAKKFSAEFINSKNLQDFILSDFFGQNKFYIFDDDAENCEENILYLVNSANEKKAFLLLAQDSQKDFLLPDLKSRIKNFDRAEILMPSIDSLRQILVKNLANRQIFLEEEMINFFCKNTSRTYESFNNLAKKIEFFCKETGKKLTVQHAKSLL